MLCRKKKFVQKKCTTGREDSAQDSNEKKEDVDCEAEVDSTKGIDTVDSIVELYEQVDNEERGSDAYDSSVNLKGMMLNQSVLKMFHEHHQI